MKAKGISQSEMARRVGVTQATIWKLIHESPQGSKHVHKIALELDTSAAFLLDETDVSETDFTQSEHLSSDERELLDLLRGMEAADRAALLRLARTIGTSSTVPTLQSPRNDFRR